MGVLWWPTNIACTKEIDLQEIQFISIKMDKSSVLLSVLFETGSK